jgi:dihydrofolate synthase / folylpolyglutamate synthase
MRADPRAGLHAHPINLTAPVWGAQTHYNRRMDYATALHWWLHRVDFEKRPAGPDDLKLDRMRSLLSRLGNPQNQLRIVHVAGSKGKGSTSAMLESVARAAGLRTGLFTSPHLCDVSERIQVNGQPITQDQLAIRSSEIRHAADAMPDLPTFFEIATALAFHHFAVVGVELAIIEVGLGGRFDSTNVCQPLLSVITSISHDHTAILGDTLTQIAFEKCGIIKPGLPVVSGVTDLEASAVVRRTCHERHAHLMELERDFRFMYSAGQVTAGGEVVNGNMKFRVSGSPKISIDINLLGAHQAANASLVVAAMQSLRKAGIVISDDAVRAGLATIHWPARMEVFPGPPLIVLDCAHNVASARTVVETLDESFPNGRRVLVFASAADKDVPAILRTLLPAFDAAVFCRFGNNPRAVATDRLIEWAREIRPEMATNAIEDPLAACGLARESGPRIVVITGSVFLAGNVRPSLVSKTG